MNCQILKDKLLVQDTNGFQRILPPEICILVTLKTVNENLKSYKDYLAISSIDWNNDGKWRSIGFKKI